MRANIEAETIAEIRITIPQAAKVLGTTRGVAWAWAKAGKLGEIYTRGRIFEVSATELMRRYSVTAEEIRRVLHG